jgi:hypothetical protein
MTAEMSMHEESLRRILEYLVDEAAESGSSPMTPRELLEVLRESTPTVAGPDSDWISWRVTGSGSTRRVAEFSDAVFDLGLDFMEAVQGSESSSLEDRFDVRDLPSLVERVGQTSEESAVRQATETAAYGVEIVEQRGRWNAGDILAIPVGSEYRFAVVLPKTAFGWAIGVLEGSHRVPRSGSIESPNADTWFYTENSEYLAGRWLNIGRDKSLIELFPKVLERFFYRPVIVPPEMADARFGFAEAPDGDVRMLEEDEANRLGVLDGSYRQSHLSRDVPRFLTER